jgi:hypothetical protein
MPKQIGTFERRPSAGCYPFARVVFVQTPRVGVVNMMLFGHTKLISMNSLGTRYTSNLFFITTNKEFGVVQRGRDDGRKMCQLLG